MEKLFKGDLDVSGVYIIKTPDTHEYPKGQWYVGATQNIQQRLREHRYNTKSQRTKTAMYKIFKAHGWDNLVLFEAHPNPGKTNKELRVLESYYYSLLKHHFNLPLLNETLLNRDGTYHLDQRHKDNLSAHKKGVYCGEGNPFYGKLHTSASRSKMSSIRKKMVKDPKFLKKMQTCQKTRKPVDCFTLGGDWVASYGSISEAIRGHGYNVYRVLKGEMTSCDGYLFKYASN